MLRMNRNERYYQQVITAIGYAMLLFLLLLNAFGLLFDNAWTLNENNVTLFLEPVSEEAKKEAMVTQPRVLTPSNNGAGADQTKDPDAKKVFNQL